MTSSWRRTLDEKVLLKKLGERRGQKGEKASLEPEGEQHGTATFGTILGAEITRQHQRRDCRRTPSPMECHGRRRPELRGLYPERADADALAGDTNDYFRKRAVGRQAGGVRRPEEPGLQGGVKILSRETWPFTGATGGKAFHLRRGRGAFRGPQLRRLCRGGRRGRARLRVHDRRPGGGAWKNREELCRRHEAAGIAYVLDEDSHLYRNLNKDMVSIEKLESKFDIQELKTMIEEHVEATGSERGRKILENFEEYLPKFKKSFHMITRR